MIQLTARMVRSYKGAAVSILLLFLAEQGRSLSQAEMRRGTGYADEAINDAVWMLREDGLLTSAGRYLWALTGGRMLPLGAEEITAEDQEEEAPAEDYEDLGLGPDDPELDLKLNESMNQSMESIHENDSLIHARSGNSGAATREGLRGLGFYGRGLEELLAIQGLTMREVRWQKANSPNLGCALARLKKRQAWGTTGGERDGPKRDYSGGGEFAEFVVT